MRASSIDGMDPVGMTVRDVDRRRASSKPRVMAGVVYDARSLSGSASEGAGIEKTLDLLPDAKASAVRMLPLRHDLELELFQLERSDQREAARPSAFGAARYGGCVDEIRAALVEFEAAAETLFTRSRPVMFEAEQGG